MGLELLHRTYQLGITEKRAEWFINWTREVASKRTIHKARFEEGPGRIMYVAGALEFERPFLAPLCKFVTMQPRDSVKACPAILLVFLAVNVTAGGREEALRLCCQAQP